MEPKSRNSRDLVNKAIHDSVLRVLKSREFKASEHQIILGNNNSSEVKKTVYEPKEENNHKAEYSLYIPHINRAEFAKKFRVIEEISYTAQAKSIPENFTNHFENEPSIQFEEKRHHQPHGLKTKLLESFRLLITAGTIFAVLFVGLNFSAFTQIGQRWLNPNKYTEQQIALEDALGKNVPKPKLLPTAGMKRENHKLFPALDIKITPLEDRIIIPKIGKNIPIITIPNDALLSEDWKKLEKDIQQGLKEGVVHYPGTATPNQNGNFFVTGHSSYYPWDNGQFKDVFALLHSLDVGDEFIVYWNQNKYNYRIREKKVVSPKDTSALDQPKDEKISTLMTCTPVGTAKNRLILTAEQI